MNTESRRHLPAFETSSLNNKFKQLWLAGIEAKLVFETHAGQAWGTLHVSLGEHPGQHQQPCPPPQEPLHRRVSPAKQRRRERREAARVVAEAAVKATTNEEGSEQASEHENVK